MIDRQHRRGATLQQLNIMEVAAGLLVAEQVIFTTIEGGVMAGYALSRPTLPLKATYTCFGHVPEEMSTYVAITVPEAIGEIVPCNIK